MTAQRTSPGRRRIGRAALTICLVGGGLAGLGGGAALATGATAPAATPVAATPVAPTDHPQWPEDPAEQAAWLAAQAFVDAGYTYLDGEVLAAMWQQDLFDAKVTAGQTLIDGGTLPIAPGSTAEPEVPAAETAAVTAFFDAGYDYADAEELAGLWRSATPYDAKVDAGTRLLDGETLPVAP